MPRLIDLSRPLENGQAVYLGDPAVAIVPHQTIAKDSYNLSHIHMGTHQGTHVDAPFHFYSTGKTIEQIPLERFMGPARLINLAPGRPLPAKSWITLDMLRPHAHLFTSGARVIYRTGWERLVGKAAYYRDYPSLTLEACQWIAARRISLLGMDTPGPGHDWLECHRILLAKPNSIVIVEGLVNLGKLPPRFVFVGLPLPIVGGDGSPIRAVAIVGHASDLSSSLKK